MNGRRQGVTAAGQDAIERGTVAFDAIMHLVLCRIEPRPPRLDMTIYPYLPSPLRSFALSVKSSPRKQIFRTFERSRTLWTAPSAIRRCLRWAIVMLQLAAITLISVTVVRRISATPGPVSASRI